MANKNYKSLPLCSKKVLKDAIEFLELALIEVQFEFPSPSDKQIDLFENQLNVDKLREFMLTIAEPLFNAKSLAELIPYKYIYRDMWRKLFIISCKLCVEYDEYLDDVNSCYSVTSNGTIFEEPLELDSFDNAMYEFGFNFGESLDAAIEKMVDRVARFGFGDMEGRPQEGENGKAVDDSELFVGFNFGNLDNISVDTDDLSLDDFP